MRRFRQAIVAIVVLVVTAAAQTGTFTDGRDGKTYKTVKIGNQTWMAQNLDYQTSNGSWCYGYDDSNCKKYGRLYTWNTSTNVCPAGWHLPLRQEWDALGKAVGGERRPDIKGNISWYGTSKKLKTKNGWNWDDDNNISGNGTDDYGFSAMPANWRSHDGLFGGAGDFSGWWAAVEYDDNKAYCRGIHYNNDIMVEACELKILGLSVRCVQDVKSVESITADLIKRIPAGYSLLEELRGDLNGDGVDDYVLIIKGTNRRGAMIFFSKGNDYKLVLENRQCFVSENGNDGIYLSFEIKKGNLYINYEDNSPRYIIRYFYTFRYRNSEFELIGYDYSDENSERSINFPAKKMLDRVRSGTGNKFKETWTNNLETKEPILLRKIVKLEDYGYQALDSYVK